MSALQPDATRKYTFKLAGAVESLWHAVAVSSGMPRARWAGQKRELCVVNGWRRLRKRGAKRCATAAGEAQPGLDKDQRGIELEALLDGNDRQFAQEVVLIFEGRGTG
jgi:hypothetical protein